MFNITDTNRRDLFFSSGYLYYSVNEVVCVGYNFKIACVEVVSGDDYEIHFVHKDDTIVSRNLLITIDNGSGSYVIPNSGLLSTIQHSNLTPPWTANHCVIPKDRILDKGILDKGIIQSMAAGMEIGITVGQECTVRKYSSFPKRCGSVVGYSESIAPYPTSPTFVVHFNGKTITKSPLAMPSIA
ncbi:MAG: hypothetical protein EB059_00705 [Alphaproteobacteria bacterium]|nr:hypothetical protein [Alphaproteobacteria bacterium]